MPTTEQELKNNNERKEVLTCNASNQLILAIVNANLHLPIGRKTLEPIDVVAQIASQSGLGGVAIHGIVRHEEKNIQEVQTNFNIKKRQIPSTEPTGTLLVDGNELQVSRGLVSVLNEASLLVEESDVVDTGHFLTAEVNRVDSSVLDIFSDSGIETKPNEKPLYKVIETFINTIRQKDSRTEIFAGGIQVKNLDNDALGKSDLQTSNLLENAKKGDYKNLIVKKEWLIDTLSALDTHQTVVLLTEHRQEAEMLMQELSDQLVSSEGDMYGYESIIMPNSGMLSANPTIELAEAVQQAQGGILVIPAEGAYLDNKHVRDALGKDKLKVVTYTNVKKWSKIEESVLSLGDVESIYLDSPTQDELLVMMESQRKDLQDMISKSLPFKLRIRAEALSEAVKLAIRYQSTLEKPATVSVYDLIENAASAIKIAHSGIKVLQDESVKKDKWIDPEDIYVAFKKISGGIEVQADDPERYLNMEDSLRERVIGQDFAIEVVSDSIRKAKAGLKDPKKPIGSFLFVGPSGVGKTELAKTLAEFLFDDEENMIRIDMSEYMEKHAVSRLIGSPPGYVGYEDGGQLTEAVRQKPYSVVTFDEIEKAHPDVWNSLLQVMDDGRLTDGMGRTVDFRNTVIIMTGNVGSGNFENIDSESFETIKSKVLREVSETFRPEFLNRIDHQIVFNSLNRTDIKKIVDIQMRKVNKLLREQNIQIELSDEAHDFLAEEGYNPKFGVRPLSRAIDRIIRSPLAALILKNQFMGGDTILANKVNSKMVFEKKSS